MPAVRAGHHLHTNHQTEERMITKETAYQIAWTYNQIEEAQKLIDTMAEELAKDEERNAPKFNSGFGHVRGIEMGVPSSGGSTRILQVRPELAVQVIKQHIEDKQQRLRELKAIAEIELMATQKPVISKS